MSEIERDSMDEEISAAAFFGFIPDKVYAEVYAVGHNEYLKAVSALKDALLQEFPEKRDKIELGCSKMLDRYGQELDKNWFANFLTYCSKNIFTIKDAVPIYKAEMEDQDANKQAHDLSLNLRHCIMATEYLNVQLLGKLKELDVEIESRKELLVRLAETEQKLEAVKTARELDQQLAAKMVELPEPPLEM